MKVWDPKFLTVRTARNSDLQTLASFTCSTGPGWEQEVEEQIRDPLPRRHLTKSNPDLDSRLLICTNPDEQILAVAAHHVETVPVLRAAKIVDLRPTYIEAIAVTLSARRTTVTTDDGPAITMVSSCSTL